MARSLARPTDSSRCCSGIGQMSLEPAMKEEIHIFLLATELWFTDGKYGSYVIDLADSKPRRERKKRDCVMPIKCRNKTRLFIREPRQIKVVGDKARKNNTIYTIASKIAKITVTYVFSDACPACSFIFSKIVRHASLYVSYTILYYSFKYYKWKI